MTSESMTKLQKLAESGAPDSTPMGNKAKTKASFPVKQASAVKSVVTANSCMVS